MASRPELTGHASNFYNKTEARKYNSSSRMIGVQREITERAIELLCLDPNSPSLVLDIGCGSGLSGQVLEEKGHVWVGCDVSRDMLDVANERRQAKREEEQKMEEEEEGNDKNDDSGEQDSSDEDEEDGPSTGDLMHHVSPYLCNLLCIIVLFFDCRRLTKKDILRISHDTGHGNRSSISTCNL